MPKKPKAAEYKRREIYPDLIVLKNRPGVHEDRTPCCGLAAPGLDATTCPVHGVTNHVKLWEPKGGKKRGKKAEAMPSSPFGSASTAATPKTEFSLSSPLPAPAKSPQKAEPKTQPQPVAASTPQSIYDLF